MTTSGARTATGRGRAAGRTTSSVRAAAPNSLHPIDEAHASPLKDGASGSAPSQAGPLRLSDPREDKAFSEGAIAGFDVGYQLGLQEGARLAAEQLGKRLCDLDLELGIELKGVSPE